MARDPRYGTLVEPRRAGDERGPVTAKVGRCQSTAKRLETGSFYQYFQNFKKIEIENICSLA